MNILITGGSGRLGSELQTLLPAIIAPSSKELDITNEESIITAIEKYSPDCLIHAAAYTDVSRAEKAVSDCWEKNVIGTQNVIAAVANRPIKLIYISTDYVFSGDEGNYVEGDSLGPALNVYALTKLVAEKYALAAKNTCVVRTSFRPREWAYPNAFTDMYTSQDYVDIIAKELALAITHIDAMNTDLIHIATERKSVFELASRRATGVNKASKASVTVKLPQDISLNSSKWLAIKERLG